MGAVLGPLAGTEVGAGGLTGRASTGVSLASDTIALSGTEDALTAAILAGPDAGVGPPQPANKAAANVSDRHQAARKVFLTE
jgi:hypothetical protein